MGCSFMSHFVQVAAREQVRGIFIPKGKGLKINIIKIKIFFDYISLTAISTICLKRSFSSLRCLHEEERSFRLVYLLMRCMLREEKLNPKLRTTFCTIQPNLLVLRSFCPTTFGPMYCKTCMDGYSSSQSLVNILCRLPGLTSLRKE